MFLQKQLINELKFKAIRSSGSGGQHVNKVSSKIELTFDLYRSAAFSHEQKTRLQTRLANRLTKEGVLIMQCGESRSQHRNKEIIVKRLLELISENLKVHKQRKATKIPKSVKLKRLKNKRLNSERKANRKPPKLD